MFVLKRDVTAAKQVIATLLAVALVLWAFGVNSIVRAANITDVSITVTDSAPGASADHTIDFVTPSGVGGGEDIVVAYPDDFDFTGVTTGDIQIDIEGSDDTSNWSVSVDAPNETITLTESGSAITAGDQVEIFVGTNAGGTNQITNPASPTNGNQSYEIDISAGTQDSGYARVVILDTVLVTAQVNSTFDFTVTGKNAGTDINGELTTGTSSSTTIPFGVLSAGSPEIQAQDLQVQTNARNGFVVTVQTDGEFRSSTGAEIDGFVENSDTAVPTPWASPVPDVLDETTWGHWGITTSDTDTTNDNLFDTDEVVDGEYFAATTTPRAVFAHDGPADNTTPDIGSTTVGFKVEISALQEAADDYQTTLTYIATPTF